MECPSCKGPTRLVATINRLGNARPEMRYYDCLTPGCGLKFEDMPRPPPNSDNTPKPEGDKQT